MDITGIVAIVVFWGSIVAFVAIGAWRQKKIEAIRHETARLLIEKNPAAIDSDTLAQLFNPQTLSQKSGAVYRGMKVTGAIVIAVGTGLWLMGLWLTFTGGAEGALQLGGPATLVMVIGAGILFAARFMPRPPVKDAETETSPISTING